MAKTKTSTKTKITAKSASRKPKSSSNSSASKSSSKSPHKSHKGESAGASEVTIDRRRAGRRDEEKAEAAPKSSAPAVKLERRQKVNRRRQIDPTTCERDYTDDEVEFMNALDDYKRKSGRMFPTCSEVLEVVRSLGYVRLSPNDLTSRSTSSAPELMVASVTIEEEEVVSARDWQ